MSLVHAVVIYSDIFTQNWRVDDTSLLGERRLYERERRGTLHLLNYRAVPL